MPVQSTLHANYDYSRFSPMAAGYSPNTLNRDTEREGCFCCRWRKKKCKFAEGDVPSPRRPCADCKKFNILCEGAGDERPPGKDLAMAVREQTKSWIFDKKNRTRRDPFDLTAFWQSYMQQSQTAFVYVHPPPTSTTTSGNPSHHHQTSQPMVTSHMHQRAMYDAVPPLFYPDPATATNLSDEFFRRDYSDTQNTYASFGPSSAYPANFDDGYHKSFATTMTSTITQQHGLLTPNMGQHSPSWEASQASPYSGSAASFEYAPENNFYQSNGAYHPPSSGSPSYVADDYSQPSSQSSSYNTSEISNRYSSSGVHNWRTS